ncbi:hypothetical protein RIR_jg9094.t1 [Rhizophagus irregularis DAOM 181602=DAOM 197198]|uniref:Uncharacterized protein n=1 Tax=Rhizophagus irregularis (strain DAOM 181602 / DAOM 197198 / MUCL 43194) TaxID=747089 RepID=U9T669_RHIID|nr:hypothetical protein RIR_jg9094.t1 [Rhizophagus irregularis DAOM 181602=DAOM 197198]
MQLSRNMIYSKRFVLFYLFGLVSKVRAEYLYRSSTWWYYKFYVVSFSNVIMQCKKYEYTIYSFIKHTKLARDYKDLLLMAKKSNNTCKASITSFLATLFKMYSTFRIHGAVHENEYINILSEGLRSVVILVKLFHRYRSDTSPVILAIKE